MAAETRALIRCAEVFKKGVDPDAISSKLYSDNLLTNEEYAKATSSTSTDYQRVDEIYKSLERRVAVSPTNFHKLLTILRDEPALRAVGKKLQDFFNEEKLHQPSPITSVTTVDNTQQLIVTNPTRSGCNEKSISTPHEQLVVPTTTSFNSVQNGPMTSECNSLQKAPIQDSQHDERQSYLPAAMNRMSLSPTFHDKRAAMYDHALRAGVSLDDSKALCELFQEYDDLLRKSEEVLRKNEDLLRENEDLRRSYEDLNEKYCNERLHHTNEKDYLQRENSRLQKSKCKIKTTLDKEREERKETVGQLRAENEKLRYKNRELMQLATDQVDGLKEMSKENTILKDTVGEKEKEMKQMKHKMEEQTASQEVCKELCDQIYDTTLQVDYKLRSLLENKSITETSFKEKLREMKTEIEERKNATWP